MAKTAAITLVPSTCTAGVPGNGRLVVTNGDANPIEVTNIVIYSPNNRGAIRFTHQPIPLAGGGAGASPSIDTVNKGGPNPMGTVIVAGSSGTLMFPFQYVAHSADGPGSSNVTIVVSATIYLGDGTAIQSSTATLTVQPVALTATDP